MNNSPTILITGANGQLGMEFRQLASAYPGQDFLFATRNELQIEDAAAVENYFDAHAITTCINCAAYTAVDKAEAEKELAYSTNATAVGHLAAVCFKKNIRFIHISTDYVFPGNGTEPYKETDETHPINVYAASKLEGERLALANNEFALIIRTSWVYSSFGKNFIKTMLRLMAERDTVNVVADQSGSPTYAADLAKAIMAIIDQNKFTPGIYQYSNTGVITWYDLAVEIKNISGSTCAVEPIATAQYPTPAMRPHYSAMSTEKFRNTFQLAIPAWQESLLQCIRLLKNS